MRFIPLTAALAPALLLAACGGDGSVAVQPIAAPPPAPTPPPPPSSFPLSASASFDAISATRSSKDLASTSLSLGTLATAGRGAGVGIDYDSASGTYTVRAGAGSATFGAADRTSSTGFTDVYKKQAGTVTDQLTLFGNVRTGGPQTNAPVALTYLSYGLWAHADTPAGQPANQQTSQVQKTYLLFGFPSTSANMPRTGVASYQTAVTGNVIEVGLGALPEDNVSGTATFDVDFGSGAVKTDLILARATSQAPLGTFNGTGTLTSDQFAGSFTSSARYFTSGSFNGGFFGPTAQEMGYAFQILKHNPDPFAGASPLPSDTAISGVVVGTKK